MNDKRSIEELNSYVRLALPMMSNHNMPITPINYTVYYTYVSGNNNELSKAFDRIITKGGTIDNEKIQNLVFSFLSFNH